MTFSSASDLTSDEDAIRAVEYAYDSAWSAGDLEGVTAAFTPDAVVINPNGNVINGLAQIKPALKNFFSGDAAATTHTSTVKAVHFVTADVALVDGEAIIQGATLPDGGMVPPLVHWFTDVLVKRDGRWLISHVRAYTFMR